MSHKCWHGANSNFVQVCRHLLYFVPPISRLPSCAPFVLRQVKLGRDGTYDDSVLFVYILFPSGLLSLAAISSVERG